MKSTRMRHYTELTRRVKKSCKTNVAKKCYELNVQVSIFNRFGIKFWSMKWVFLNFHDWQYRYIVYWSSAWYTHIHYTTPSFEQIVISIAHFLLLFQLIQRLRSQTALNECLCSCPGKYSICRILYFSRELILAPCLLHILSVPLKPSWLLFQSEIWSSDESLQNI